MTMRFKLRSSLRDESADTRRLNSIKRSLSRAIDEATFEKEGLQRRIDAARQQASVLLGSQTSEYLDREPESEQLLLEAERNLVAGERRILELKAQGSLSQAAAAVRAEVTSARLSRGTVSDSAGGSRAAIAADDPLRQCGLWGGALDLQQAE
jgi:hypothetical protein